MTEQERGFPVSGYISDPNGISFDALKDLLATIHRSEAERVELVDLKTGDATTIKAAMLSDSDPILYLYTEMP